MKEPSEKLLVIIRTFLKGEEGTETVEWAIVAALIIGVAAAAWVAIGGKVASAIGTADSALP